MSWLHGAGILRRRPGARRNGFDRDTDRMPAARTKLVCTIGPASRERIAELVAAGMDVARLNFSHGSAAEHQEAARSVRGEAAAAGRPVAVLADLPGPKVRLGELPDGELELAAGQTFTLVAAGDAAGDVPAGDGATVSHRDLARDVREGDRLMLSDGAVELRVSGVGQGRLRAEVVRGGTIRSGAGVNVPSQRLSLPAVTEGDRAALGAIGEMEADFVAQSFVRGAADVGELRSLMGERPIPIMAKIETAAAVRNLDGILEEADAVMLARGDLGVEIPFAEVPILQKRVIDACVARAVPVVVATQMLESMVGAPRPTRAEASDVANAVLDGTDAVMLSAETAIGAYPVLAARAALEICSVAEADPWMTRHPAATYAGQDGEGAAIAAAAVELARRSTDPAVSGIACFTRTGLTARLLSALRPGCPIIALSPDPAVVRRLALLRAVAPLHSEMPANTDEMIAVLDRSLRAGGLPAGARVVAVASMPFGTARTNFLKLHRLGH